MRRIVFIAVAAAVLGLATGCGNTSVPTANSGSAALESASSSSSAPGAAGSQGQPGSFTTGSATITSAFGQATLDFTEGLYVAANGSVVANFADGASNDPSTNALGVSGSPGGLTATLIGPLQRQGVTTECTVSATRFESTGFEGTFECAGDVSGTFEAH